MKIEVTTTFLDGADRFEAGDQRTVPDERGAVFVKNGWAKDLAGNFALGQSDGAVDLSIHNAASASGDSNG